MYNDIFELNDSSPELFLEDGIRVSLLFNSNDNFAGIGIDLFWVDKVGSFIYHGTENNNLTHS